MKLRGSEIQDFLRCRTRWDFRWRENLQPKKKNKNLYFGTLFHKYLEVLYQTKSHVDAMHVMMLEFSKEIDYSQEIEDLHELLPIIADNYYKEYFSDLSTYTVVATELQFEIPLVQGVNFTGTIDLILRDKDDNLWFVDHKTTSSVDKYEKNAIMDRQINRYWWAIQQLAEGNGNILNEEYKDVTLDKPFGFIYNIILKDTPREPKALKTGQLSKDKSQKTTYALYIKAINDLELNPDDYADMLEHLKSGGYRFFKRVEVFRNQQEINITMDEIKAIADDMVNPLLYRNITGDCHWDCAYKDVCQAQIEGHDDSWLIEELFEKGAKNDGISN